MTCPAWCASDRHGVHTSFTRSGDGFTVRLIASGPSCQLLISDGLNVVAMPPGAGKDHARLYARLGAPQLAAAVSEMAGLGADMPLRAAS